MDSKFLGLFVVGEKPAPLIYQFQDSTGAALNLTGYLAGFSYREMDSPAVSGLATLVSGINGTVQHIWTGAEFASPGHYKCEFWTGNSANRFASVLITYTVRTAIDVAPNI